MVHVDLRNVFRGSWKPTSTSSNELVDSEVVLAFSGLPRTAEYFSDRSISSDLYSCSKVPVCPIYSLSVSRSSAFPKPKNIIPYIHHNSG